jgi:hypothetical protein
MNIQNKQPALRWGVHLTGHRFDLLDWEEALRLPFDPWVERVQDMYVLRWSGLDGLELSEVNTRAEALIDQLNGAMAAARGSRPARGQDVVQFAPDGTRHHFVMLAETLEFRDRIYAATVTIGSDGAVAPAAEPKPSEVQEWAIIADTDDRLADALVYLGRREWFDLYKAIECMEDWAGGEAALGSLGWFKLEELKRVKRTANSFRHRRGGRHSPPPNPATAEEAFGMIATLVKKAFETVQARSQAQ